MRLHDGASACTAVAWLPAGAGHLSFHKLVKRASMPMRVASSAGRAHHGVVTLSWQGSLFDSDQGTKTYRDCVPDHRITDYRDLLRLIGAQPAAPFAGEGS